MHEDVTSSFPVLKSKVLDINVARSFCRDVSIDHVDGRHVVFIESSGIGLVETQFLHDRTEVTSLFAGESSCKEFSLMELVVVIDCVLQQ